MKAVKDCERCKHPKPWGIYPKFFALMLGLCLVRAYPDLLWGIGFFILMMWVEGKFKRHDSKHGHN